MGGGGRDLVGGLPGPIEALGSRIGCTGADGLYRVVGHPMDL